MTTVILSDKKLLRASYAQKSVGAYLDLTKVYSGPIKLTCADGAPRTLWNKSFVW